jgi:hypothetical protein
MSIAPYVTAGATPKTGEKTSKTLHSSTEIALVLLKQFYPLGHFQFPQTSPGKIR